MNDNNNNNNKKEKEKHSHSSHSKCVSIKDGFKCNHIERIIDALIYYSSLDINNNNNINDQENMVKYFNETYNYTYFIKS